MDTPGTLHHVMIRGIGRIRIVDDEQDRREFVRRLGELAVETATPIYARALLDNHAHLLQRLAALAPRPRLHLIRFDRLRAGRFHGVLAPNASRRSRSL